ncbi:MAG: DUF502 domain-containing protein [Planctomycetota bacterium]|nr:MAG: DUF502 domain-containing protein [Planctomycetota bacterium]REK24107.1 MAG: DUF502 domain-containing protein [Planctomycetota bacterium]REK38315.1 MAG: DUF502 domain-containing protein [Planctomycetota bacterium]
MHKKIGVLKTTALGGVIFLLPLIIIGALLGQIAQVVYAIAGVLGEWLPIKSAEGVALLLALAILIVLLICFIAGFVARRSFGRRFSGFVEKHLVMFFPRYAIIKEQMTGTIGGDETRPTLKPVSVSFSDCSRIGFQVESAGENEPVTIYLPGSPDPWIGSVVLVEPHRVRPLPLEFAEASAVFEQLGRGTAAALAKRA